MTKVIFRKFRTGGDIIAFFPEIPGASPHECMSYMHIGQHGAASTDPSNFTDPATEDEYEELLCELESIGYRVEVVKRFTPKHAEARRAWMDILRQRTQDIKEVTI